MTYVVTEPTLLDGVDDATYHGGLVRTPGPQTSQSALKPARISAGASMPNTPCSGAASSGRIGRIRIDLRLGRTNSSCQGGRRLRGMRGVSHIRRMRWPAAC